MKALNFNLPSTNQKIFSLKENQGKYIVLYFYPKDDTPGCTIETIDFNKPDYLTKKFRHLLNLDFPSAQRTVKLAIS